MTIYKDTRKLQAAYEMNMLWYNVRLKNKEYEFTKIMNRQESLVTGGGLLPFNKAKKNLTKVKMKEIKG